MINLNQISVVGQLLLSPEEVGDFMSEKSENKIVTKFDYYLKTYIDSDSSVPSEVFNPRFNAGLLLILIIYFLKIFTKYANYFLLKLILVREIMKDIFTKMPIRLIAVRVHIIRL